MAYIEITDKDKNVHHVNSQNIVQFREIKTADGMSLLVNLADSTSLVVPADTAADVKSQIENS